MKKEALKTIVHSSLSDSLRAEWEQAWKQSPTANIENSPGWFEAACEAFRYEEKAILAVYAATGKNLVAIAPLVRVGLYGLRVFTMPGLAFTTHATVLGDVSADALSQEIVEGMKRLGTVYLTGLAQEQADAFRRADACVFVFPSDREYVMDFSKGPFGECSKRKKRAILNRAKNAPAQMSTRTLTAKEDCVAALQACFTIDRASAKHQSGKGVFWREDARLFYTLLAEKCPGCVSVTLLYFGGMPVAYDMQFVCKGAYVETQKAYLPEYRYYNPGFLAFIQSIESVPLDKRVEISFGKGEGRFKTDMTKKMRVLSSAIISEHTFNRAYLARVLQMREQVYRALVAYSMVYAWYKRIKK